MPRVEIRDLQELRRQIGREVAVSDWLPVTQERIDLFAEATGDRQWIHLDAERAAAESPFGGTVAHGFLTLSLLPRLAADTLVLPEAKLTVNYGLNRVRFPSPVRAGQRIRAHFSPRPSRTCRRACSSPGASRSRRRAATSPPAWRRRCPGGTRGSNARRPARPARHLLLCRGVP